MGRRSDFFPLRIWMNGLAVADWSVSSSGRHELRYESSWLTSPESRPLSLSLPMRESDTPYYGQVVENYFENLLPDSIDIRRRIQARFAAASPRAFDLLKEIGRDCVGAVQLLPPGEVPEDLKRISGKALDETKVAQLLRDTVGGVFTKLETGEEIRISLAGAQEKTALLWHRRRWHRPLGATPTTHILKLPLGRIGGLGLDLSESVENEWLCSRILEAYGMPTASCEMGRFEDQKVLIVERFDRRRSKDGKWWLRLPQEDMCQATGTSPTLKYEADGGPGIRKILAVLMGSRQAAQDRWTFFQAQVLNWMLCAPDGHAKNYSIFIEPGGGYTLTPLYDVLSAYPILGKGRNRLAPEKAKLAMAVLGRNRHYHWNRILRRHWISTAKACGLNLQEAESRIQALVEKTPDVVTSVSAELPEGFPVSVSTPILEGLTLAAKRL